MAASEQLGSAAHPRRGVWRSDAAEGDVTLVVYNSRGKRLLRIEFATEVYSATWVPWLERWLRKWDRLPVRLHRG